MFMLFYFFIYHIKFRIFYNIYVQIQKYFENFGKFVYGESCNASIEMLL